MEILKIIYLEDTFGDMNPEKVVELSKLTKKSFSGHVGFHAHNNKGLALINSITAVKEGITYTPTVMGMGRGAGNAQTENLLIQLFTTY